MTKEQSDKLVELAEHWAALEYDAGLNSLYQDYNLTPLIDAERAYKEFLKGFDIMNEMTSKELYAQLEAAGWSFGSEIDTSTGVSWYAYKRLPGWENCACNDKPPSLIIKPYALTFPGSVLRSVNFEIRGMLANGHWVEFAVYGVKYEEVLASVESCTEVLLTAWNAVAGL